MDSKDNSFESMESAIIKELYKKTPLKKRPIQHCTFSPDEKKVSPKPRAMLKPTKKLIDSYVETAKVSEPEPKAVYAPAIKISAEAKASPPVEVGKKAVNIAMTMAIPKLEKTTSMKTKVPSKRRRLSWAFCRKNFTEQEWEDFTFAQTIQKKEFNLRERPKKKETSDSETKSKDAKSPVKAEDTSAESKDSNSISSEVPNEVGKKKDKKEIKRMSKRTSINTGEAEKGASSFMFTGSHSRTMYLLSPELSNIVGHTKMSAGAIVEAMHYVFLERNLFEPGKQYVICDDELSEKLFAGKRRLLFDDVKNYLCNHVTLTDE